MMGAKYIILSGNRASELVNHSHVTHRPHLVECVPQPSTLPRSPPLYIKILDLCGELAPYKNKPPLL